MLCSINLLMQLANGKCQEMNCELRRDVFYEVTAGCVIIKGFCQNGHQFSWSSSEFHTNKNHSKIFDSNVILASAVVLSGNSFAKIKMFFDFMQLAIISGSTFYSYQRQFICPTVNKYYVSEQECVSFKQIRQSSLIVIRKRN